MARSPKTAPRKAKRTPSVQSLKSKVWDHCRRIVRARYVRLDGTWTCFTCDRLIDEPGKAHTGHFIPSSSCGGYLRFNLRNLRVQDYYCNVNLGGNGAEYYRRMVLENGQEYVDQLFRDKNKIIKLNSVYLTELLNEYGKI